MAMMSLVNTNTNNNDNNNLQNQFQFQYNQHQQQQHQANNNVILNNSINENYLFGQHLFQEIFNFTAATCNKD
jgi:hypothetical protein